MTGPHGGNIRLQCNAVGCWIKLRGDFRQRADQHIPGRNLGRIINDISSIRRSCIEGSVPIGKAHQGVIRGD